MAKVSGERETADSEPSMSDMQKKAIELIKQRSGLVELYYDSLSPTDVVREKHALTEIRKFVVEINLLSQEQVDEVELPSRKLRYERVSLGSG